MRIISQDGTRDLNYEQCELRIVKDVTGTFIFADTLHFTMIEIAKYSTEAKAHKAMEMLHNEYHGYKIEETYHDGTEYYHPIFQFPADDEVVVDET